jgi:cell division cycle 20-like protein 1, cofactor of APC complex
VPILPYHDPNPTATMASFNNTPFAKRLRAAKTQDGEDSSPRRGRPRNTPIFGVCAPSTPSLDSFPSTSESGVTDATVAAKDYGDRFVPSRDSGDLRTAFHLLEDMTASASTKRLIPTESDAQKEQANSIFASILHTEVTPSSPARASSPVRQSAGPAPPSTPNRKRLFNFNTPSRSNPGTPDRRMDTPNDEAYSMSPVRQESRQLLESPRRKLRNVCKTPYRVLDAPELADDFYLNLVDWSSTNVLSVGLGSCVYLWAANTAAVSKLCDLSDSSDIVSSVSWVQKVRFSLYAILLLSLTIFYRALL